MIPNVFHIESVGTEVKLRDSLRNNFALVKFRQVLALEEEDNEE